MTTRLDECPTCSSRKIRAVKKDLEFLHQGRRIVVSQVECEECPDCGEVITDYAANQYIDSVVFGQKRRSLQEAREATVIHKHKKQLSRQVRHLIAAQASPES